MRRFLLILALVLPIAGLAQTYPDQSDPHVVDLGEMLSDAEEATLRTQLETLMTEDETEMVIVTLPSVAEVAGVQSIQEYSESLFDTWALGDATRNDGIIMVVFRDDRELWIALGAGYDGDWTGLLTGIVQYRILPNFSDGNVPGGMSIGVDLIRDMIVRPFRAGQRVPEPIPAPEPAAETDGEGGGGGIFLGVLGAIIAAFFGLVAFLKRRNAARLASLVCENCGHKGLEEKTETTRQATTTSEGERKTTTSCPACGHATAVFATIPVLSASSSSSSPSGGKSGGGGAGGSW